MSALTFAHAILHQLTVTEVERDAPGGVAIDRTLIDAAKLIPLQQIEVVSARNGQRWKSFLQEAPAGSGTVRIHSGATSLFELGHVLDIIVWVEHDADQLHIEGATTRVVSMGSNNSIARVERRVLRFRDGTYTLRAIPERGGGGHPLILGDVKPK